jgi:hypothetical protein
LGGAPAFAEDPLKASKGEGAFGAGVTTGDIKDDSVCVRGRHSGASWSQSGQFTADYGKTEDVATKQRYSATFQTDLRFDQHASSFGRFTWDWDEC